MKTTIELAEENENLKATIEKINKRLKAFYDENDGLSAADDEIIWDMYLSTMSPNI